MKIKTMTKLQAKDHFEILKTSGFKESKNLSEDYLKIRRFLLQKYDEITSKTKQEYIIDMFFGISMYQILNEVFDMRNNYHISSNMDFWRYLNMEVIPDIVYERWGDSVNRFYIHDKRNYSYSVWWYIHLSWQGSNEETIKAINFNTTDTIVQLTERSGRGITGGYSIDLYREIIRELGKYRKHGNLFRRVMELNTMYTSTIEPKFYDGGYENYVKMLFYKANNGKGFLED